MNLPFQVLNMNSNVLDLSLTLSSKNTLLSIILSHGNISVWKHVIEVLVAELR